MVMAKYIDKSGNIREIDFDAIAEALKNRDLIKGTTSDWFHDFHSRGGVSRELNWNDTEAQLKAGRIFDEELGMWIEKTKEIDNE